MRATDPKPKWWVHWLDADGNPHSEQFDHYVGDAHYGVVGAWDKEHALFMDRNVPNWSIVVTSQPIRPELGEGPRYDGPAAAKKRRSARQATLGMEGGDDYASVGSQD